MTKKLIVNDGRTERELILVGNIVVGRDPICEISGDDVLLSRRHAEFLMRADAVVVRDLGSRNGIFVNGVKVAEGQLAKGDRVRIGHLQLQYVEDAMPLAAALGIADGGMTNIVRTVPAPPLQAPATQSTLEIDASADSDYTRLVPSPSPLPSPPVSVTGSDDDDYTRLVRPPVSNTGSRAHERPPVSASEDPELTRIVSAPVFVAQPASSPVPAASTPFIFVQLATLAAVVFAAAITPFLAGEAVPLRGASVLYLAISVIVAVVATYAIGARISRRTSEAFAAFQNDMKAAANERRSP